MNKIKQIRERKNLTQVELAKELNMTQGIVSSWENGRYSPSIDTARKIAAALGCTMDELFGEPEKEEGQE